MEHHRKDDNLTQDEVKIAMKEAIKEWLDEKMQEFGLLSVKFIAAACLGALAYFVLTHSGWVHR